jgi:tRNA pseudouridine55 synthase
MINNGNTYNFPEGELLLIDKPFEWTSFDVVNKIRSTISRITGIKKIKVGHAGTLDPLATGLLIICTGKFTKRINALQLLNKEYTGTFFLGATTPSFDKETEADQKFSINHLNNDLIQNTITHFVGEIDQVPPIYSAIKVDGIRAYHKARKNDEMNLKSRKVKISEFIITNINLPDVNFRVVCSKGTYIRALARDFGIALNSGAHLSSLRRTKIGDFSIGDAQTITEFIEAVST